MTPEQTSKATASHSSAKMRNKQKFCTIDMNPNVSGLMIPENLKFLKLDNMAINSKNVSVNKSKITLL